jgi:probable phosphoglycerate mutase
MIEVFTDGLAMPRNPGIGTYGFVVYKDGSELARGHGFDGDHVSNNHAEYAGLIAALKSVESFVNEDIVVKSDSKMLVNQMAGRWKVSKKAYRSGAEGNYVDRFLEARDVSRRFERITYEWIPRELNSLADALSRIAYRQRLLEGRTR